MYIPESFRESDVTVEQDFIEDYSFGLLVSQDSESLVASHLPFVLDRSVGAYGTLAGHMARANPQWKQIQDRDCLVVFSGPHCYVSPTWYEAENMVPTWNYVAVHAYGRVEIVEDHPTLLSILKQAVAFYEHSMPQPWTIDETTTFIDRMLKQIVGFRISIERLEGKWKLNQNHPEERRRKVIHALDSLGDENSLAIAKLMQGYSKSSL